jgi:hypothetical protein
MKHLLHSPRFAVAALFFQSLAFAGVPFDSAKVSLIENKVYIGNAKAGGSSRHPAESGATVTAKEFIATDAASRAELKFADNSIVRVGQNSIFSFEAGSRTLSLKEGTMLFYVPHDSGGGNIKTPSFTAAITGTVGKVSDNLLAVLKGEVKVTVDGKEYVVPAGWVLEVIDHQVRLFKFKPGFATEGALYFFGGLLPETPDTEGNPYNQFDPLLNRPTHQPQPPAPQFIER